MGKTNVLSIILLAIFVFLYGSKLIILYKKNNIKANVLGNGNKDKEINFAEQFVKGSTFLWGLLWFLGSIGDRYINIVETLLLLDLTLCLQEYFLHFLIF